MKVLDYIRGRVREGKLHMTLLDPDKQTPEEAARRARLAAEAGTDAVMVGGSSGFTQEGLDATVRAVKAATHVPTILFPAGAHALSPYADAVYFMAVMNSRDVRMVVGEQSRASRLVKSWGLEPIPMGYIIVEPGMKVGEVGQADLVPRDRPDLAVGYALAAQYLGMELVYLEAGSGAPKPVPPAMVRAVKRELDIPLIVGGGIRSSSAARRALDAGADIVVTGTVIEDRRGAGALRRIVSVVKGRP